MPPTPDDLEPVAHAAPPSAEEVAAGQSLPLDDVQEESLSGQSHPVDDAHEEPTPDTAPPVYSVPEEPVDQTGTMVGNTASQRMPTEIIDADGTPLAVLDEAALQEIVRQMIREELQGDLGERITRNVRKLVRAEINRALMARDLD
jgi:cell pole-organizing protein PopZ